MTTFQIVITLDTDRMTGEALFDNLMGHVNSWPDIQNFVGEFEIEIGHHEWAVLVETKREA